MSQAVQPVVEHPMLAAMRRVHGGLDDLAEANCWSLADTEIGVVLEEIAGPTVRRARRAGCGSGCSPTPAPRPAPSGWPVPCRAGAPRPVRRWPPA